MKNKTNHNGWEQRRKKEANHLNILKKLRLKCEGCGDLIPKDKEKYAGGLMLCSYCFHRLRVGRKKRKSESVREEYFEWVTRPSKK